MNRSVRTSKTGGVVRQRAAPRGKKWSLSANAQGFGIGGGLKISSKRANISRAVAPSSTSTTVSQYKPKVSGGSSANSFTIENRELLSSVTWQGTNGFELTEYAVNPGLSTTFQYASNVSKNYTRYAMNLCVIWAPSVPSTASGQIAFAMDRDNTAPAPSSMQEILSYENNVVTSLWKNVNFPVTGMFSSSEKLLYLRYGPLDDFSQINLYDLMKIFVVLNGIAGSDLTSGASLGSLYIQYKITFFNQKLQDVVESNVLSVNPTFSSGSPSLYPNIATAEDSINYQYNYGDGDIQYQRDVSNPSDGYIAFPSAGYYTLDIYTTCTAASGLVSAPFRVDGPELSTIGNSVISSGELLPESQPILLTQINDPFSGHIKYILRVTESGTYLSDDGPVGEGWVSVVGNSAYSEIVGSPSIGTLTDPVIDNSYIVINRISGSEASYYVPTLFPQNVTPGPLSLISHRKKFYPIRGHARRREPRVVKNKTPKTSPEVQISSVSKNPEPHSTDYKDYLLWKQTH